MSAPPPQPASSTKHLPILHHSIPFTSTSLALRQISSTTSNESTGTTGSTLWLSAQLLSLYLLSLPSPKAKTVLDLGSGIGYLPLCLRSKGYEVISTDIPAVIDSVLRDNISNALTAISPNGVEQEPAIEALALDWEIVSTTRTLPDSLKGRRLDVITTSDTLYAPHLLDPLLQTLQILSDSQKTAATIYVGLERRDPGLIDRALDEARAIGLTLNRIDKGKIDRLMLESGWESEEWDDVEIWKGKFGRRR